MAGAARRAPGPDPGPGDITGTAELDEDNARTVDAVLHQGHGRGAHKDPTALTSGQLRPVVARIVTAVDADAVAARAAAVRARRAVTCTPLPDGAAELNATGPAEDVLTVMAALGRLAERERTPDRDGQPRGIDARRFDALLAWAQHALDTATPPDDTQPGGGTQPDDGLAGDGLAGAGLAGAG